MSMADAAQEPSGPPPQAAGKEPGTDSAAAWPMHGAGAASGDGPGLRASLEAILLVVDEPVTEIVIAQVLERPREEIAAALRDLAASYTAEQRGFDLREVAGGWRFYTREECARGGAVRARRPGGAAHPGGAGDARRGRVPAAGEPGRVSAVRGVNCDSVLRTLTLRGLVEESGTEPETGAILYRTTGYFLERLGLASLAELPELAPFLPDHVEDVEDAAV